MMVTKSHGRWIRDKRPVLANRYDERGTETKKKPFKGHCRE
jgi:hypothetical protein